MSTWRIGVRSSLRSRQPILRGLRRRAPASVAESARSASAAAPARIAQRGEQVQLRGEREVLGPLGDGLLELDQGRGGAGLEVEQGAGDQVGEDPDAVDRGDLEAGGGQQRGGLVAR